MGAACLKCRIRRALSRLVRAARRRPAAALAALGTAALVAYAARARLRALAGAAARALPDLGEGAEQPPDLFAGMSPAQALDFISSAEVPFSDFLATYGASFASRGWRLPPRHALIRAAVKASSGAPVVGAPPLTDNTGHLSPAWAPMLAIYDVRPSEWAPVAAEIETWERPAPGWFDTLRGLISSAAAAASGNLGPALRFIAPSRSTPPTSSPPDRYRAWTSGERALLAAMRRAPFGAISLQEAMGGARSLRAVLYELAGRPANASAANRYAAAALRRLALAQDPSSVELAALPPDALLLKAALVARRWPTPGVTPVGDWPRVAAAPPAASSNQSGGGTISNQSAGGGTISNQSAGGGFISDQSSGGWP